KREGLSILLVEQNLPLALAVADRVHILSRGQIVHSSGPADLMANEAVKSAIWASPRASEGGYSSRYLVLTVRSQSSAYSFWYCGHTFSSATLRKAATSLALTFIPFASRISLARWRLSTLSVASRTLACASRETSVNSLCA